MGRRLFQKFVRAGRDGRPWRAAGIDFWNKRHGFLTPIVAKVQQSGPWGRPWTDGRDGPPGGTFETNGTDSWRRLLQKSVRAGRGRPAVTGRRNGLLKQTARIPGADCCRSSSERVVDGRPWRAAGRDFWNKRHGFLAPIVAEVRQSGPWEPAVDGRPWREAGVYFWNKRHGFLTPIVAKVNGLSSERVSPRDLFLGPYCLTCLWMICFISWKNVIFTIMPMTILYRWHPITCMMFCRISAEIARIP